MPITIILFINLGYGLTTKLLSSAFSDSALLFNTIGSKYCSDHPTPQVFSFACCGSSLHNVSGDIGTRVLGTAAINSFSYVAYFLRFRVDAEKIPQSDFALLRYYRCIFNFRKAFQ